MITKHKVIITVFFARHAEHKCGAKTRHAEHKCGAKTRHAEHKCGAKTYTYQDNDYLLLYSTKAVALKVWIIFSFGQNVEIL